MLKCYCDICAKETTNPEFYCEGTVMNIKESYDLTSKTLNPQNKMQKRSFHLCQKCYNDNLAKLLK